MADMPDLPSSSAYQQLIGRFALGRGMPAESVETTVGLEFESDNRLRRVRPHPQDDERLMLEVDVITLNDEATTKQVGALLMLHQLNYAARTEHDWSIVIDDDLMLMLSAAFWIPRTDEGRLEAHITEGIERAQALRTMWEDLQSQGDDRARDTDVSGLPSLPGVMIRG